ncbi:unnamed protein product [Cercopithifilaria johnstoni]|uniref:Apple domain-containing protein n=1 Tax=Cercopithifilaria johnstoni TaxID=2874296 RepID=A0A8J2MRL0_9BILA|nr:unnamed protein product [Cercopithifilaria johnstoni]
MEQWYFRTILIFLFFDHLNSQNIVGNEIDFDKQKVVTLGPPRNGSQRAVFDEVIVDDNNGIIGEITQVRNDIDAYDDKFVDLRGEEPLFIPKPYRKEKEEQKITKQSISIAGRDKSGSINSPASLTTHAQIRPNTLKYIDGTSTPIQWTVQQPLASQPPIRQPPSLPPPRPLPRKEFLLQPSRIISQQPLPTSAPFRSRTNPQVSQLIPRLPQFVNQSQQFQTNFIVPITSSHTTERTPSITLPITPSVQPPQPSPRIGLPPPLHSHSNSLRTGVCFASIFYISTPMRSPKVNSFTHFAMTVSTDQCARTCHEFNCALAHYDPLTGRCEFNPSTAFAIRKGQCPPWPSTHYKNNIRTNIPLRIFCVQCHRKLRRGRVNKQGNHRFTTTVLRTVHSGKRLPGLLKSSGLARMHSVLSKKSDVIVKSSFRNVSSRLEKQHKQIVSNNGNGQRFISNVDHRWDKSNQKL